MNCIYKKLSHKLRYFSSTLLLFFSLNTFAQQNENLITGNFNQVSFNDFVQKVEAQSNFHFYYNPSQFDSTTITISVTNAHLPSVLDRIFANTDLHYFIDKDNHVFITKGFSLAANLPYGFFNGEQDTTANIAKNESNSSAYISQKKAKEEISIENKLFN